MADKATIDLLVHPVRWVANTRYRNTMLSRPKPPHTWRLVCRDPEGGFQIVACVSFTSTGRTRMMRAPLESVKR